MSDFPMPEPAPEDGPGRAPRGLLRRAQPLLAMLIALSAIGLAAWEGLENRRHNRLSVQPRLGLEVEAGRDDEGAEYVRIGVASTGLGPAVVRSFGVALDGVPLDPAPGRNVWDPVLGRLAGEYTRVQTHALGVGSYLRPGQDYPILEARRQAGSISGERLVDVLARLGVEVCYCSVYGDACETTATGDLGERVECG